MLLSKRIFFYFFLLCSALQANQNYEQLDGEGIYPNNLKNWNFGDAKAPGLNDRKLVNMANIDQLPIVQSRELSLSPKSNSSSCLGIGWLSLFCLPQKVIDDHFQDVQDQVNLRWNACVGQDEFPPFSFEKTDDSLAKEFYHLNDKRIRLWLESPQSVPCRSHFFFKVSQKHIQEHRFRQPNCVTFEHSATDPSYNASSISIEKRRFIALEGPLEEHAPYFFRLLANWNVAFLVCLTDEADHKGTPKCFPYWEGKMTQKGKDTYLSLTIDGPYELKQETWAVKELPYLFWPDWEDHHGVNPQTLVERANQVRRNTKSGDIIAVHCSAGVGRTGTFIATICLLDHIDEQLARGVAASEIQLCISKLFLYLNFHRPWLVAKPAQYITLYRTVEWYLNHKQ